MISLAGLLNFLTKNKNYPIGYFFKVNEDIINKINAEWGTEDNKVIVLDGLSGFNNLNSLFNKYLDTFFNKLVWSRINYPLILSSYYEDADDQTKVMRGCLFLYHIFLKYSELVLKYGQRIEYLKMMVENYEDYLKDNSEEVYEDDSLSEVFPDTRIGTDLEFPNEKNKIRRKITRKMQSNIFERVKTLNAQIDDVWGQFLREFDIYFDYERI